jgi:3-methyladenine DNA glycosylase AlkD
VTATEILRRLQSLSNAANVAGMARFGIRSGKVYGVSLPEVKRIARQAGRDHVLAKKLWSSGVHEARLVACFIENPARSDAPANGTLGS